MQKFISTLFLALFAAASWAYDFESDGIYYKITSSTDLTAELTSGPIEYSDTVKIPESVTYDDVTYAVTSIGSKAFYFCIALESVTIPNSVTSIGERAFGYCVSLKSIYVKTTTPPTCGISVFFNGYPWEPDANLIYDTVILHVPKGTKDLYSTADKWKEFKNIVEDSDIDIDGIYYILNSDDKTAEVASSDVKYTGNVVIPESVTYDGVTYTVTSIGDFAFYECEGLTSVTIPNSVTSIAESAFESCTGLTSVDIPNSVTSIGESAFCVCTGLKSVTIPNSVTRIAAGTFGYCKGLTSVTIPNTVTSIGNSAFYSCSSLKSVTIPNSVTSIERYAFGYCPLESVTIPNSVTSIEKYAFCVCRRLSSLVIGNSVESIGEGAFIDCEGLTSVTIPNSVTEIGYEAFWDCSGLTSIYVEADTPPRCYYHAFGYYTMDDYGFYDKATLHVVEGTKDLYSNAFVWEDFKNITDDLTSGIEEVSGTEVSGTRKYIQNGRIVIEKNGKQFTVDGARMK